MRGLRIPSFTTPGTSYVVQPHGTTMDLVCECPAFRRDRPCKHVRIYRSVEHALVRCQNAGHLGVDPATGVESHHVDAICPTCLATIYVAAGRKAKSVTREALDDLKARLKRKKKEKAKA